MTEPYSTIITILCLLAFAAAGILLIYWAARGYSILLFILAMALVFWPIMGDILNLLARNYARESLLAGDSVLIGIWQETPGTFITKVAAIVKLIQAGLVLEGFWGHSIPPYVKENFKKLIVNKNNIL